MLYIFLVDTGNMVQLDMNLALETVGYLKGVVARSCCIPPEKQVLLISGGESLEDEERVCKYAAGTDTNPIFLFSLASIDSPVPPEIATDYGTDNDLAEKIESSLRLKEAQSTVSVRAALAQEVVKASSEQTRICETLIHDQHLQHQGWAAVVANLEDTAMELQRRNDKFDTIFQTYLSQRERQKELIDVFDDDMALLHQIPVFPALLKAETVSMVGSMIPNKPFDGEMMTLLEWISSRGSSQSLEQLADSCYRSLQQMDPELLVDLKSKVGTAIEGSHNSQMKEIRGLGDRLSALEQLLIDAKRLVQEQGDLAKAFVHNQQRASGLNDLSILPDLCASHREQLLVMRQNHQKVISIRSRCAKAKGELSANLHHRMKWVVYIQNQMADVQQLLVLHSEELKRLEKRLQVMEQLHLAPSMYLATAVEVVRRKAFSRNFLQKANCLADKFSQLHKEEMNLRASFQAKLKKHFLSKMFPGMEDVPPEFASIHPEIFDDRLPEITLSDVDVLRKAFPDLAKSLSLPDETALEQLLARSFNQTLTPEEGQTLFSLQSMPQKIHINSSDIGSVSVMNKLISDNFQRKKSVRPELMSDSETDTEQMGGGPTRRRQTRKKSGEKLTRSLPPLEASLDGSITHICNESTGFSVEEGASNNMEPSSSSGAPSSSSGVNTANCSSVAPSSSSDGSVMKQGSSQQWPPTSDDKSALIASLTSKITDTEGRICRLQEDIKNRSAPTLASLVALKDELLTLKDQIYAERESYAELLRKVSTHLVAGVENVHREILSEGAAAIAQAEKSFRAQSEREIEDLRQRLELEAHKLEDCQREIENYRVHFEQTSVQVDHLKSDLVEEKEKFEREKRQLELNKDQERELTIKSLTLEHELELDALRHKLEHTERSQKNETELAKLKEELMMKENDIEALRRKTRLLESAEKERFNCEKEKIVQILEAGFSQREKLSVQQSLEAVEAKHREELLKQEKRLRDKLKVQLENSREKIKADFERKLNEAKSKFRREIEDLETKQTKLSESSIEEIRRKLLEEKEAELKSQADKLNAKAKRELDALRQRFKIMQTTVALERSPSVSESELSMESPRMDVIDNVRSAMLVEFENNQKAERSKFQLQFQQLKDEHQQQIKELLAKGKIRDTAEQQINFNEALKKAMDEKNRQLDEVTKTKKDQEDLIQQLRAQLEEQQQAQQPPSQNVDATERLAELTRQNAKLEMELQEARSNLDKIMSTSVLCLPPTAVDNNGHQDVARLQKENQVLKEQLSKSMMNLVKSGRVSVTTVDRGDNVMVVWNEDHSNYMIYTEGNSLFHFLHSDSVVPLGLSPSIVPRKQYITAEVVDKEYCQARKPENRFKVPQGTKFYRVKCKPLAKESTSSSAKNSPTLTNGNENGGEQ